MDERPLGADPPVRGALMSMRFRDVEHVIRVAIVFLVAILAFAAWRAQAVPDDFGVYGHFRTGALADNRDQPLRYAGQATCVECHTEQAALRQTGRHAMIACESCHGPQGSHASGDTDVKPPRPDPRGTCLPCHVAGNGKAATFPQVVVRDHAPEGACTDCHKSHAPGVG
jgi:Cytochrome c554 and c-prime